MGKLPWHADWKRRQDRRSGRCFFGADEKGNSILGPEADRLAEKLCQERAPGRTGTSICLVGFEPLGTYVESQEGSSRPLAAEIAHIAETWYWPAIFEGRLAVTSLDESTGAAFESDPFSRTDLEPFIDAWEATQEASKENVRTRQLSLSIPAGPGEEPAATGRYHVGCTLLGEELMEATDPPSRTPGQDSVALVRGFGMVVEYRHVRPRGIRAHPYAGVCRAGMAVPVGSEDARGQQRLEALLSSAEPPAHDRWNPLEVPTADWRGAQARVGQLLKSIEEVVTDMVSTEEPAAEGETLPELSRLFRFSKETGPPSRSNRLSITRLGGSAKEPNGDVRFPFRIDAIRAGATFNKGKLLVRIGAEVLDSGAGPLKGVRGEAGQVVDVAFLDGPSIPRDKTFHRPGEYSVSIDLSDQTLPLDLVCVARPPSELLDAPVHLGLLCRAAIDDETFNA